MDLLSVTVHQYKFSYPVDAATFKMWFGTMYAGDILSHAHAVLSKGSIISSGMSFDIRDGRWPSGHIAY